LLFYILSDAKMDLNTKMKWRLQLNYSTVVMIIHHLVQPQGNRTTCTNPFYWMTQYPIRSSSNQRKLSFLSDDAWPTTFCLQPWNWRSFVPSLCPCSHLRASHHWKYHHKVVMDYKNSRVTNFERLITKQSTNRLHSNPRRKSSLSITLFFE
jgi:hypothetical protein